MIPPSFEPAPHRSGTSEPEESIKTVLRRLATRPDAERVSLAELIADLDTRAYGFVLLLCTVPNLTPGPSLPGFSTVFGLPAIAFAVQMILGRPQPWLPHRLARITVSRPRLERLIERALPLVDRADNLLRPRFSSLTHGPGRLWLGLSCLLQGVLLALPVPVFSMVPAFALMLLALGLIARDGAFVLLGHLTGLAGFALGIGLAVAAARLLGWA